MKPELQRLLNSLGDIMAMSHTWNINHERIDAIIDCMKDEILSLQKQSDDEGLPMMRFIEKYSKEVLRNMNDFDSVDASMRFTYHPRDKDFEDREVVLSLCVRSRRDD